MLTFDDESVNLKSIFNLQKIGGYRGGMWNILKCLICQYVATTSKSPPYPPCIRSVCVCLVCIRCVGPKGQSPLYNIPPLFLFDAKCGPTLSIKCRINLLASRYWGG